jgi:hypothetical protein
VYWDFKYDELALPETLITGLAVTELPRRTAKGNKHALLSTDDNDSWHCAVNCN